MQDGFAAESRRRQEDYNKMGETMTAKMEEGFRNEQQVRQAQKEIISANGADRLTSNQREDQTT